MTADISAASDRMWKAKQSKDGHSVQSTQEILHHMGLLSKKTNKASQRHDDILFKIPSGLCPDGMSLSPSRFKRLCLSSLGDVTPLFTIGDAARNKAETIPDRYYFFIFIGKRAITQFVCAARQSDIA